MSDWSTVYANQANLTWSERAKRATRASEPHAVFANEANRANHCEEGKVFEGILKVVSNQLKIG